MATFEGDRGSRARRVRGGYAWAFVAGAVSAVALVVALAIAAPGLLPRIGSVGPASNGAPDRTYIATGLASCPLTKPEPPFDAPIDADLREGVAWYGTSRLWTLLDVDGERWTALPEGRLGLTQKLFYWRDGYRPSQEPRPEIYVTGDRLDGPGRFGFGAGTNASFGLGSAMLVGVEVPLPGCWEITARYYAEELTYVVWVAPNPG